MKTCVHLNGGNTFKGVIHCGAHNGEELKDYLLNGVEHVAWFEANQNLIETLKQKTSEFNELQERTQLKIKQYYYNVCLSDVEGEKVTFNFANNGQSSSILPLGTHATMYPHIQYVGKQEMIARRMDNMVMENFKELDIRKYDFVNLDVQGAELKVLKGFGDLLSKPWIKAIYTELNFEQVYKGCALAHEIENYLSKFGFVKTIVRGECVQWADGLFLRLNHLL